MTALVEAHHGNIQAASTAGLRSTFTLRLPLLAFEEPLLSGDLATLQQLMDQDLEQA